MLKKIIVRGLIAIVVIVAILLVAVAMQPAEYHVERTADIAAPTPVVFEHVNDLHNWQAWSPWAKLDPDAKNTFEGPSAGEGAVFQWSGNDDVGEGSMTIVDSQPPELIQIRLDFIRPFEDTAMTEFRFQPAGDQTKVTWVMDGKNNFIGKAFCLFMDMDAMIGADFERGLKNLQSVAESAATPAGEQPSSGAGTSSDALENADDAANQGEPVVPESSDASE